MERTKYTITKGWTAFVKDGKLVGIKEFPHGGKADTILTLISKPTKEELLAELASQNIPVTQ